VEQYLIFAEGQAIRRIPMYMADWIKKLDAFLSLNERDILTNAGKVSKAVADQLALNNIKSFTTIGWPRKPGRKPSPMMLN
jgi:hypothetical protein